MFPYGVRHPENRRQRPVHRHERHGFAFFRAGARGLQAQGVFCKGRHIDPKVGQKTLGANGYVPDGAVCFRRPRDAQTGARLNARGDGYG